MEHLFSTNININNKSAAYQVYFDREKYIFQPAATENDLSSFSFKRENDEWHGQESISADLQDQAIEALENYLLAQH